MAETLNPFKQALLDVNQVLVDLGIDESLYVIVDPETGLPEAVIDVPASWVFFSTVGQVSEAAGTDDYDRALESGALTIFGAYTKAVEEEEINENGNGKNGHNRKVVSGEIRPPWSNRTQTADEKSHISTKRGPGRYSNK